MQALPPPPPAIEAPPIEAAAVAAPAPDRSEATTGELRGADAPVRLVKKTRNMGVWLNSRPVLFEGAPGFYMTASTRPLSDIADFGQLRRLGVGVDHLRIDAPEGAGTVTRYGGRDVG